MKGQVAISYRSKTDKARKSIAAARRTQRKRKALYDKDSEFGPPDKRCNFSNKTKENHGTVTVDENVVTIHPNLHPEVGFMLNMTTQMVVVIGITITFNGKYGVFFPSDNTSEEFSLNEEEFIIID